MAEICAFGWVAEWFKAAVLKTAYSIAATPSEIQHFRHSSSRNGRILPRFARRAPSHSSAQFVHDLAPSPTTEGE
jgi:hypothetical protein